jgi:hypothetical protein
MNGTLRLNIFQSRTRPSIDRGRGPVVSGDSGQAVIEYLLLLVILLSVLGGITYQFSDAFRRFSANFFGNYVTCLLEAGELPGNGGICGQNYKPFSLADGKPLIEGGSGPGGVGGSGSGGSGGNGSGPNGSGGSNSGRSSRNNSGRRNPTISQSDGAGQSEAGSSSSKSSSDKDGGSSAAGAGRSSRFKGTMSVDAARKATSGEGADGADGSDPFGLKGSSRRSSRGYSSLTPGATAGATSSFDQSVGRMRFVPPPREDAVVTKSDEKIEVTDADRKGAGRRVPASFGNKKQSVSADADVGLTLPNFIRYLLIAAIAIAIVLFLGGQAVALKKGQEKG